MIDPVMQGLLGAVAEGDLNALLMLTDYLEERGDPRSSITRKLFDRLNDDAVFAPQSFRFLGIARETILPLFPEYRETPERFPPP